MVLALHGVNIDTFSNCILNKQKIKINLIGNKDPLKLNVDLNKIQQVFLNLFINASQAMPNGGKLEINISKNKNFVVLDFIDSGEGISNENLPKVFEPLFTTKQKGTGLGLASCKNIIEQHEGKISVKNNPTKFTIMIPRELSLEISKIKNKEKL